MDWGAGYGTLPNKLWGFVNLSGLPPTSKVNYGGIKSISPGIYAIVESATMIEDEHSELVLTVETDVVLNAHGEVDDLQFYLADVEAFVEPAIVVPDIGGKKNRYLLIMNKSHWRSKFESWLEDPQEWDEMDPIVLENNVEAEDNNSLSGDENEDDEEENKGNQEDNSGQESDENSVPEVSDGNKAEDTSDSDSDSD